MVVAILSFIIIGHIPLEPDEVLGDYYPRTKARVM
jgi:hypothetical protein